MESNSRGGLQLAGDVEVLAVELGFVTGKN
jgi:hypothetical protein